MPLGTTQQFTATGTYSNGSTQNITTAVTWSSSPSGIITRNTTPGFNTAHAVGSSTITATSGSVSGHTKVTVSAAALTALSVTPASASVPLGTTQQFVATGIFTDGSTQNVTSLVTWTSSASSVSTINATGLAQSEGDGTTNIIASSGSIASTPASFTVLPAVLESIAITPANSSIALGTTQQLTATGTFSDGSTQNLTSVVTWNSSAGAIASISAAGLATSAAVGNTTISATSGSVAGSTTLIVSPAQLVSIAITPAIPSIPLGTNQQFAATGTFTDHSTQNLTTTVQWSSSAATVATIGNSTGTHGLASGLDTGTTNITATSGSISGSTTLTVTAAALESISITPTNPYVSSAGTTQQFTATGTYTDSSTQDLTSTATWSSSVTAVATVSSTGLAQSAATGSTTITASVGNVDGMTTLTVTAAALTSITVDPGSASIPLGTTQPFTATGNYADGSTNGLTSSVYWSSSAGSMATISNAPGTNGLSTSVAVGSATISATSGSVSGTASLTVTPPVLVSISITPLNPSIALGASQQFTATGTYSDESTQNITTNVAWFSSAATVAVISNSTGSQGLATSSGMGSTTITAAMGSVSASTTLVVGCTTSLLSIAVTPSNPTISIGGKLQFTATGTYAGSCSANLTNSATWSSSNTAVVTINNSGYATGVAQGSATITAGLGAINGSTTPVVPAPPPMLVSIAVTPASPSILVGNSQQFTATGTYSNGSTQNLTSTATWSSSTPGVATINAAGMGTSVSAGSTTITAAMGAIHGSTALTVSASVQAAFAVVQAPQGTCIVNYNGVATAESCSPAGTLSATTLTIHPNPTVAGHGFVVVVSGEYYSNSAAGCSDNSSSGTSNTYTPIPAAHAYVNLTNYGDSSGFSDIFYVASSVGSVTQVQCTLTSAFTGGTGDAEIWFIELNQPIGGVDQVAVADNQSAAQTSTACPGPSITTTQPDEFILSGIWLSQTAVSASSPFTLGSAPRGNSIAYDSALSTGTYQPTYTASGTNDGYAINVVSFTSGSAQQSPPALASIAVTPASPSVVLGNSQPFTAIGTYSDGSTQNLTSAATWSSSAPGVATMNTTGVATGVSAGSTMIAAAMGAINGSTALTVKSPTALTSIAVTPANPSIVLGNNQPFTATGTYSDGSTQNLTGTATWSSSSPGVATINTTGVATGVSAGSATITAAMGAINGSTTLTVSASVQAAFAVVQAPQGTCIVNYSGVATAEPCSPAGALSSTTLTIHPNPTVAGHGFVVVVSGEYYSNSAAGCSDNSSSGTSNTYTPIPAAHAYVNLTNYGDSSGFSDIFYVASSVGSVTQVQCTLTSAFTGGTGDAEIWFIELNQPIGGVDQVAVADNQSAAQSSTACPGPSITTTQPDEFILSGIWLSQTAVSASSPFTLGSAPRGNSIAYDSALSTGAYLPTYTASGTNDGYAINVVSFTSGPPPAN